MVLLNSLKNKKTEQSFLYKVMGGTEPKCLEEVEDVFIHRSHSIIHS